METHEVLFLLAVCVVLIFPICLLVVLVASRWRRSRRVQSFRSNQPTKLSSKRSKRRTKKRVQVDNKFLPEKEFDNLPILPLQDPKVISVKRVLTSKGIRTIVVERKMPSFPCHGCKESSAKKDCTYKFCASCCRNSTNSVCAAHGTGFDAAQERVLQACRDKIFELDLSFSHLTRYPQHIPDVGEQLELLNLSTNRLSSLPSNIGRLNGVQECFLQYNCLKSLPDDLCSLKWLQELDVKNNRLTALPENIGDLMLLRILTLSNNALRNLPKSIEKLQSLEELNLHQNELKSLPEEICNLENLENLYLGKNHLTILPKDFGKLVSLIELDLSECKLTSLPDSICDCINLDKLWLSHNQLTVLPARVGDLKYLREFHIRSNRLQYLPGTMLRMNPYTFTAQDNMFIKEMDHHKMLSFTSSPENTVPSLQEIICRFLVNSRMTWKIGTLPDHLERYLATPRWCTRCAAPYFEHVWTKLNFGVVVVARVPLLHEFCSPFCEDDSQSND